MSAPAGRHDAMTAVDDHFQQRRRQVPVLARRAEAEGITEIRSPQDVVPLLFPHTTYKSYPEALIAKGRWEQMNRWLDSLSTHRVTGVDVAGVTDVDGWIERLEAAGHLVSSSSGTSGKASFLNKSARDREASMQNMLDSLASVGLPPEKAWNVLPVGPDTGISAQNVMRDLVIDNYAKPDGIPLPESRPVTGHHRYMARLSAMRKAMAEGTASPDDVAAFEAEAAERQKAVEERLRYLAEHILARRTERMFFNAMFPNLFRLCEILKEMGAAVGDISGENALSTAGGLKGMPLPPDYRAQIFELLNIAPTRFLHYYSMQELNLRLPKCLEGRYHVPEGVELFVLTQDGESLAPASDGQVEGRAAFVDTSVDGRWGGTMSGDKVRADFGPCPCGRPRPTVFDDITRYSDSLDGDKLTCAGTMDAYVRGFIDA